ncbi:long-chain N-acyl amino acid synthase [Stieleria sp. TO1_6]|uniref:N-acyl amino acid synthase FeeM domain-containing protein n=1 Tax=Stieleria tagensis TaxID=2956795 RepID=UPI00209B163E|nr:long-chain N-acyl amino acid synthase [Stieleria tagensis]MCO8122482.1 long-chain N-acyl amino acid synthase [Stieleria tagensis]
MQPSNAAADSVCPLIPAGQPAVNKPGVAGLRYEIAFSYQDLHDSFSLVYKSYRRAGLAEETGSQIRLTPFHLLSTTEVFVTRLRETIVSTVSLIGDGAMGLPLEAIYPTNVNIIRRRGLRMAEVGCLADRRESPVRFIETFAAMGKLLAQVAMARGYDGLVAAVHPKHARLYRRVLPFVQIGNQVTCPYANGKPAVMLALVFEDQVGSDVYERFFGSMGGRADTTPRAWSDQTRDKFAELLRANQLQTLRPIAGQTSVASAPEPRQARVPKDQSANHQ